MEVKYRTETFAGSGERRAEQVIAYEMFQLGNTDIADTLFDPDTGILRDTEIARIWPQVVGYKDGTLDEDDMDEDMYMEMASLLREMKRLFTTKGFYYSTDTM